MRFDRSAGILLHISSLPGPFGIGDLGDTAFRFVDFLESAGQKIWQVLPLGPPALGNSPYSCYSAFAGNPLLISPAQMAKDGWLDPKDHQGLDTPSDQGSVVCYTNVAKRKLPLLRQAYQRSGDQVSRHEDFRAFCDREAWWLDDFARFESLMSHFDESDWTQWPEALTRRDPKAIKQWDGELADAIRYSKFIQFIFDQQFRRLKRYANDHGIRLFGDMPIFVAHQSADVWANQELFWLDDSGAPTVVAGVPPDYFSETGQLWGNPLYRWEILESTNFAWWTARFAHALNQFDLLRVDHFRGFESYWEVPANAESAIDGRWRKGPQDKPFSAAAAQLGELAIVAEDLGMITEEVHALRKRLGFPAMRVLQFGFESTDDVFHHPDHYPENSVAYTGTHDNDTIMGWLSERDQQRPEDRLLEPIIDRNGQVHLQLIQAVLDSNSDTAVIPFQDYLGLGNDARMNVPGQADGNWSWRAGEVDFTDELAEEMRAMVRKSRR